PLRWSVLIVSVLGALGLIVTAHRTVTRALASVLVAVAVVGSAAIPAQLAVRTIADSTQGSIVTIAGTSSAIGGRPGGGGGMPAAETRPEAAMPPVTATTTGEGAPAAEAAWADCSAAPIPPTNSPSCWPKTPPTTPGPQR